MFDALLDKGIFVRQGKRCFPLDRFPQRVVCWLKPAGYIPHLPSLCFFDALLCANHSLPVIQLHVDTDSINGTYHSSSLLVVDFLLGGNGCYPGV